MDKYIKIIKELTKYEFEEEWFEFKENWFDANGIGEYISALSNVATICNKEKAYLIWGINDKTHEVVGTSFNFRINVKNEPLEHFLARQITPDISFSFHKVNFDDKIIVLLEIDAAKSIPTSFNKVRYTRIGSSKVDLSKYPEREIALFEKLRNVEYSILNIESEYQDLTFLILFTYYSNRNIKLNEKTFKKNLGLLTKDGKYNLLAQLLSDNSHIPIRVSIFRGVDKSSFLISVREFGNTCLLLSLDKIIAYADAINIVQADERERFVARKEVPLFDMEVFREAIINAFVHNKWVNGNAPMITIFRDRLEILSRGTIAPNQSLEGFYLGESVPVNPKLSDIFLQLHISERTGRGVPIIINKYGKKSYEFRENSIVVTIPFEWINSPKKISSKDKILKEIENDSSITQEELSKIVGIGKTAVQNNIKYLKENGYIKRIGSNKKGYWEIL